MISKGESTVFHAKNYVLAQSLDEAWELNQKRTNKIVGGMAWMKMGKQNYQTVIDLSALHLDQIQETEDAFSLGCMVTLHQMEIHPGLETCFQGAVRESVRHIVGVQFRNCATVGGSLFGRFGFSDVLTCFLALGAEVELYRAGRMSLERFASMPYDNDILVRVLLPKKGLRAAYQSMRNTATDFPVLAVAVSLEPGKGWLAAVGARPGKAVCHPWPQDPSQPLSQQMEDFATHVQSHTAFGTNMRGSAEYRRHLCGVLMRRAMEKIKSADPTLADC